MQNLPSFTVVLNKSQVVIAGFLNHQQCHTKSSKFIIGVGFYLEHSPPKFTVYLQLFLSQLRSTQDGIQRKVAGRKEVGQLVDPCWVKFDP